MSRPVIAAMSAYTLEARNAPVKLNQNESGFDLPPALKAEILETAARLPWNRYPDFESVELRQAIAGWWGVDPENVLAGNGSNELLAATISTFIDEGANVILPRPAFALYEKLVTIAGGRVLPVDSDPRSGFLPIAGLIEAARAHAPATVIVCSPDNPTGSVLPPGSVQQLLDTGATVLLDRAYADFESRPLDVPLLHERLIVFSTLSKAWGIAALRVGWLIAAAPVCREIRKVKLPYSLNVISETAAVTLLRNPMFRDANVATVLAERSRVMQRLQTIRELTPFPSEANFICFRVSGKAGPVFEALHDTGVLIRDVSSNAGIEDCLRVSIGSPTQNDAFLKALDQVLPAVHETELQESNR